MASVIYACNHYKSLIFRHTIKSNAWDQQCCWSGRLHKTFTDEQPQCWLNHSLDSRSFCVTYLVISIWIMSIEKCILKNQILSLIQAIEKTFCLEDILFNLLQHVVAWLSVEKWCVFRYFTIIHFNILHLGIFHSHIYFRRNDRLLD